MIKGRRILQYDNVYYVCIFMISLKFAMLMMRTQAMGANVKMAETMGATSKVMADMNKMMNPQQVIIIIIIVVVVVVFIIIIITVITSK